MRDYEQRAFLLQFVHDLGETKLKSLGFRQFSRKLLNTVTEHVEENGYSPVEPFERGHNPALSEEKQAKIAEMFYKFSKLHSAREANKFADVFVLEKTQEFVARECCRAKICSVATAKVYKPADVLLSTRQLTDLCEMCEDLIDFEHYARKEVRKYAEKYPEKIAATDLLEKLVASGTPLSSIEKQTTLRLITDINTLKMHFELNEHQRKAHKIDIIRSSSKQIPLIPMITIILDFKSNVKLGEEPRERSNSYYGYSSCSVLGFAVYLPGRMAEDGTPQPVYIDCLSLNLGHDSLTAVMVLKLVLNFIFTHEDLKSDAEKARKLVFWCDCGPHFRSKRFFYALFCEIPEMEFCSDFVEIILNFFLEKHGKSVVDGHFGMIVFWVKLFIEKVKKRLITIGDLRKAIEDGWETTSLGDGKSPPVYVLEYGATDAPVVGRSELDCFKKANMKKSYCFRWQNQNPTVLENFGIGGMIGKITPDVFDLPKKIEQKEDGEESGEEEEGGEEEGEEDEEEEGEEEEDSSGQARFTKWARDVAPEAQTDFGKQRKTHQYLRRLCGKSLLQDNLSRIMRNIDKAQADAKALGALSRVKLPSRQKDQMPKVKELLSEPGRGLLIFAPDAQAWTVANVEYKSRTTKTRKNYVEVVIHHPTGAVSEGISLAALSHMVLPLSNAEEACLILDVNFFSNGSPEYERFQVDVASWKYCEKCKRWRVIPAVTREHLRKRNAKFFCEEIHPKLRCEAPLSDYEKRWKEMKTDAP